MKNILSALAFVLTYGVGDSALTLRGMMCGMREANSVAVLAMRSYGFSGFLALKLVGIATVFSSFLVLKALGFSRTAFCLLFLSAVAGVVVCLNNLFVISSYLDFAHSIAVSFMVLPFIAALEFQETRVAAEQ